MGDDVTKIFKNIASDKPGIPTTRKKPHLGESLLAKFANRISAGFDDLMRFQLIDRLEKPVLHFILYGNKRTIIELHDFLSQFPYSFVIRTKKGLDLWSLPERGVRTVEIHYFTIPKTDRVHQAQRRSDFQRFMGTALWLSFAGDSSVYI